MRDPTRRFSDRVADYARARPSYPRELLDLLRRTCGLEPAWDVADVGSGTGNLTRLFLDAGHRVWAVEPNAEMRRVAETAWAGHPRFVSVDGRAEATGLEPRSVDLLAAGQAFHWFDRRRARKEFRRVLRAGAPVMLVWNDRVEDSAFQREYEALLLAHGTDYRQVQRRRPDRDELERFFGVPGLDCHAMPNRQVFDLPGLRARLRSSSYVPAPGRPGHDALMLAVDALFDRHQREGRVVFDYATRVYIGRFDPDHRLGARKPTGTVA